jgi:cleavage and polyadenylation specificity factor subunit 1
MERQGIIRRSKSNWASLLHMVHKADSSWRPCNDYRQLNPVTSDDKYPIPNVQNFTIRLHGCQVFSKLDLKKGYYQVKFDNEDI